MQRFLALIPLAILSLSACGDNKQAELEQQLKAQQEQIAKQQAQLEAMQKPASAPAANAQDQTVYQLQPQAVNETLSAQAQEQGKNGQPVTGNDGQQYVYDSSTGSWLLQSLVGAAAGAFIGNALANKFARAPANSPAAQQVRTQYAQQYTGRSPQAPATLSPRQQAAANANNRTATTNNANNFAYRPAQQTQQPRYRAPSRSSNMGGGKRRR